MCVFQSNKRSSHIMLDKELAQATKLAQQANKRVEKLRGRLLKETEKAHAGLKRDLTAARKKHSEATTRLNQARAAMRSKSSSVNQRRVDDLLKQVQELTDSMGSMARAAYDYAERLVPIRADLALETRKAQAAERAAEVVEKATKRQRSSTAASDTAAAKTRKKAPAKKTAAGKKAAVSKKAPVKKAPVKKAPVKKAAVKKTPAKKVPAKKAASGTAAAKAATVKQSAAASTAAAPAKRRGPGRPKAAPKRPED